LAESFLNKHSDSLASATFGSSDRRYLPDFFQQAAWEVANKSHTAFSMRGAGNLLVAGWAGM
jgi:hypothetical protein